MARKALLAAIIGGGMLLFGASARAVQDSNVCGMCEKGSHGLVDICSGWFELPMQIYKGYEAGVGMPSTPAGDRSLGMLVGVVRGVFHGVSVDEIEDDGNGNKKGGAHGDTGDAVIRDFFIPNGFVI